MGTTLQPPYLEFALYHLLGIDAAREQQMTALLKGSDPEEVVATIRAAIERDGQDPDTNGTLRRMCTFCEVLQTLGTFSACELLVELLNHMDSRVQRVASAAISTIAVSTNPTDGMNILKRLVYEQGTPERILAELPRIITACQHEMQVELCVALLQHEAAEVVAAAIQSLSEIGDPRAMDDLKLLTDDPRSLMIDPSTGGEPRLRIIGRLAREAMMTIQAKSTRNTFV